jgi:hypothetical protein
MDSITVLTIMALMWLALSMIAKYKKNEIQAMGFLVCANVFVVGLYLLEEIAK